MPLLFDWDFANRAHVAEHDVRPEEAEQVINNSPFDLEYQLRNDESRTVQLGETDAGRVLVVVTTWRGRKIRVVTAFPANRKLRKLYERLKAQDEAEGSTS
jgi:uncharacterized DUF497 family protein